MKSSGNDETDYATNLWFIKTGSRFQPGAGQRVCIDRSRPGFGSGGGYQPGRNVEHDNRKAAAHCSAPVRAIELCRRRADVRWYRSQPGRRRDAGRCHRTVRHGIRTQYHFHRRRVRFYGRILHEQSGNGEHWRHTSRCPVCGSCGPGSVSDKRDGSSGPSQWGPSGDRIRCGNEHAMRSASEDWQSVGPIAQPIAQPGRKILLLRAESDGGDYCTGRRGAFYGVAFVTPLWRAHAPFRLGEFELNVAPHRLLRNGSEVEMTAKELKLLAHFVARQGRALALQRRPQRRVGHAAFVTPRSIDRCVTTLRAKMESSRNARSIFRPFGTSDTVLIPAPSEPVSRMAA